jgi:hypothetical protein
MDDADRLKNVEGNGTRDGENGDGEREGERETGAHPVALAVDSARH